jgi:Core-2/I-Branching enzyme
MLAYHIMGSANPEHAARLLGWIYSRSNIYLVTFDNTSAFEKFKQHSQPASNVDVKLTPPVTWGGITMVSTILSAMAQLSRQCSAWKYFVLLSDSDVPLKCQSYICSTLETEATFGRSIFIHINAEARGGSHTDVADDPLSFKYNRQLSVRTDVEFVVHEQLTEHFRRVTESPIYITSKRLQFHVTDWRHEKALYIRPLDRVEANFRRRIFSKYEPRFGKTWCILSRWACNWLLEWEDLSLLFTAFSSTFCPDESFFHTAFGGAHFPRYDELETSNRFRWLNGTADKISDEKLVALRASPSFFARKVWPERSAGLFDWIDTWSRA